MKKIVLLFCIILQAHLLLKAQGETQLSKEKEEIKICALNYGDGWYSGSAERMAEALHPELNKVLVTKAAQGGKMFLQYSTVSGLIEMARGKTGFLDEDKRKESVSILDVEGDIACARINTARFNDFLQMVKADGKWKIVNVLWTFGPDAQQKPAVKDFNFENEKESIIKTALDFCEGILNGDTHRISGSANPEINISQYGIIPSTGKSFVNKLGLGAMTELINNKLMVFPSGKGNIEIKALDSMDGYAFIKSTTPLIDFYLQMAKMDDKWQVINVLFLRKQVKK